MVGQLIALDTPRPITIVVVVSRPNGLGDETDSDGGWIFEAFDGSHIGIVCRT